MVWSFVGAVFIPYGVLVLLEIQDAKRTGRRKFLRDRYCLYFIISLMFFVGRFVCEFSSQAFLFKVLIANCFSISGSFLFLMYWCFRGLQLVLQFYSSHIKRDGGAFATKAWREWRALLDHAAITYLVIILFVCIAHGPSVYVLLWYWQQR